MVNSCTCPGRITRDALWLTRSGVGAESIVRIGIDPSNGRLASRQDTLLSGNFNNFSVTADGSTLVIDDGTQDYSLWALGLPDALKGKFVESQRLAKTSTRVGAQLSPDGSRLLLARNLPTSTGGSERRFSILPFGGGNETPLNIPGSARDARWTDPVTVVVSRQTATGIRVSLIDVRNGALGRSTGIADSLVTGVTPLPEGWAWIAPTGTASWSSAAARPSTFPSRHGSASSVGLSSDPAGQRLAITGWNAGTYDSVGVAVVPVVGGTPVLWAASAAEQGAAGFLDDGAILFTPWDTPESAVLYRVAVPGRLERLGSVPRPIAGISPSKDLRRVAVLESNYHGDAYMSRIVDPSSPPPMSDASSRLASALSRSYRIERELGQGGMATVYLAHDLKHDRQVAIKVLRPELASVLGAERFLQEIRLTARLRHPHILPLYDSGAVDGRCFT